MKTTSSRIVVRVSFSLFRWFSKFKIKFV